MMFVGARVEHWSFLEPADKAMLTIQQKPSSTVPPLASEPNLERLNSYDENHYKCNSDKNN
eukprot:4998540-Amphidinium_carterae.1